MSIDPKDLREGDRVRFTLCGTVTSSESNIFDEICVDLDGGGCATGFTLEELALAEIDRLDPPIRVGDRVEDDCGDPGTVVHLDGDRAWLRYDNHPDVLIYLAHLTRISEGSK